MKLSFHLKKVHSTIQKALSKLKHILRDHEGTRKALCTVRDEIQNQIEKYADNVIVVIYLDEVLDGSIEIRVGRAENQVRVSIKSNGDITYDKKRSSLKEDWNFVKTVFIQPLPSFLIGLKLSLNTIKEIRLCIASLFGPSAAKQSSEDKASA